MCLCVSIDPRPYNLGNLGGFSNSKHLLFSCFCGQLGGSALCQHGELLQSGCLAGVCLVDRSAQLGELVSVPRSSSPPSKLPMWWSQGSGEQQRKPSPVCKCCEGSAHITSSDDPLGRTGLGARPRSAWEGTGRELADRERPSLQASAALQNRKRDTCSPQLSGLIFGLLDGEYISIQGRTVA